MSSAREREIKEYAESKNLIVNKSGGSLGVDLVIVSPDRHLLIEQKDAPKSTDVFYCSQNKEQYKRDLEYKQSGYDLVYVVRWFNRKGMDTIEKHEVFEIDSEQPPILKQGEGVKFNEYLDSYFGLTYQDNMDEKERIDFIRKHGTKSMKDGIKSIFGNNKYKPIREEMWEKRLYKGKLMVRKIKELQKGDKK